MNRAQFDKRVLILRTEEIRERAIAMLRNLPVDAESPLQVTVDVYRAPRKKSQSDLMWAGPLADMEQQAYVDGKRFRAAVWHEWAKENFLPEEFDPEQCREGYAKWEEGPDGKRKLVGSTTMLTKYGMSVYLEQLFAAGANLGVQFSANPNEGTRP